MAKYLAKTRTYLCGIGSVSFFGTMWTKMTNIAIAMQHLIRIIAITIVVI